MKPERFEHYDELTQLLSRMVDETSLEVRITLTLDDGSGVSQQVNAARVGQSQQWQSESFIAPQGVPFSVEVIWSALGVDGIRVDYARTRQSFSGVITNESLDLSFAAYSFDEFNDGL